MASDDRTHYVIAPSGAEGLPADWQARASALPGLAVIGGSRQSLQVRADGQAVAALRQLFGDALRIEAALPRRPA
jgi:hypothetical protein